MPGSHVLWILIFQCGRDILLRKQTFTQRILCCTSSLVEIKLQANTQIIMHNKYSMIMTHLGQKVGIQSAKTFYSFSIKIQRSAKGFVRGCEKFVPALAYLLCLALPGSCLARFAYFLADLCTIYS